MKVGYMTNAFGPLVGHGNGVVGPDVYKRQAFLSYLYY